MKTIDLTGARFGRLTAHTKLPSLKPGDGFRWLCHCDCGGTAVVKARLLTYKNGTRSCGCLLAEKNRSRPVRNSTNLKHGHTARQVSPEYKTWSSMIQRCTNPKSVGFAYYGGRGIRVCQEWLASFEQFLADMGPRPENHSIDRIDPNGPYAKGNCRWATNTEQALNKRNRRRVEAFGVETSCADLAAQHGIPERTIYRWAQISNDVTRQITDRHLKAKPQ